MQSQPPSLPSPTTPVPGGSMAEMGILGAALLWGVRQAGEALYRLLNWNLKKDEEEQVITKELIKYQHDYIMHLISLLADKEKQH